MKRYLPVILLAFLYGGVECSFLDKLWWWKSGLMVPYWIVISAVVVGLAYLPERRTERALTLGLFCAFVVLDAGYWFFASFPRYPFPVYNWWGEWWDAERPFNHAERGGHGTAWFTVTWWESRCRYWASRRTTSASAWFSRYCGRR